MHFGARECPQNAKMVTFHGLAAGDAMVTMQGQSVVRGTVRDTLDPAERHAVCSHLSGPTDIRIPA